MSSLPKHIQQQLDEAEALQAQLEAQATPPDPNAPPPAETPDANPEAPPATPETPTPPAAPVSEDWEQKYRTLQGIYNADTRRMQGQLNEALSRIADLERPKPETTQPTPAPAPTPTSTITDKDIEAFGTDVIDLAKRIAADAVAQARGQWDADKTKLEQEISVLKTKTESTVERQAVSDRNQYFADLTQALPNWKAINDDEAFKSWCREIDPIAGHARQLFLNSAWEKFDIARTVAFFNQWAALNSGTTPPAASPAPRTSGLEKQLAPTGRKADAPVAEAPDSKIWTTAEIDAFYSDVRKGVYRGREDARAAQEALIDQAVASGRVR